MIRIRVTLPLPAVESLLIGEVLQIPLSESGVVLALRVDDIVAQYYLNMLLATMKAPTETLQ